MKFTLSWLLEHLETEASLEEICKTLNSIGLEVEEVIDPAKTFAEFRVAHVVSTQKHPDADKLKICEVNIGSEILQVVCGANNAKEGMLGIFAPTGSYIPGSDITLKKAKIRGVESNGMLCSEKELELSDEHDGIIEINEDLTPGTPAAEALGINDPIIQIAITPNRPDCLGVRGIARDLAAAGIGTLKEKPTKEITGDFNSPIEIALKFSNIENPACKMFVGYYIRNVNNKPSPRWLKKRLKAIGLRPINAIADITNYISYDRGRPLHAYDADKISGNITVRMAKDDEVIHALDDKEYKLDTNICVIADENNPLCIGGIIGGVTSGVSHDTKNVFLEAAYFDPINIAESGRKLNILSDARYRLERGVDPAFVLEGNTLAINLIIDICGGEPSKPCIAGQEPLRNLIIEFNSTEISRIGGINPNTEEIITILEKLGFKIDKSNNFLNIRVPEWRPDINEPADIVEEVIRIIGIDNVPASPLSIREHITIANQTKPQKQTWLAKRALACRGMVEIVTYSFITEKDAIVFSNSAQILKLDNPISSEMSHMRPSLLPGIITAAKRNIDRGFNELALFEVGQQFSGMNPEDQKNVASGIRCGLAKIEDGSRNWSSSGNNVDVFSAKADAISLLETLGAPVSNLMITTDTPNYYHPGRSGVIKLGHKSILAYFGEIHPAICKDMKITVPIVGFEVFYNNLPQGKIKKNKAKPALNVSDFQTVKRDFAFIVDSDINAETVIKAALNADKKTITNIQLFDQFTDESLGNNKKSLAIEITLQPQEKTMTDEEIEAIAEKVIHQVTKATNGALR